MKKEVLDIRGMHCRSCEVLIEEELEGIPNVTKAIANQKKGRVIVKYTGFLDPESVDAAVERAGYEVGSPLKWPWLSRNSDDYLQLFGFTVLLLALFFIAKSLGLLDINLVKSNNYSSLPVVFLIGITAGLSTCIALVGGLVLGASSRYAQQHPESTTRQKFIPHIFFNLGRIASYAVLGGLLGVIGGAFQMSLVFTGFLTIAAGVAMLFLGLQLTGVSPRLKHFSFTLPKDIADSLGIRTKNKQSYSHRNALTLGALTFFLPCGFTQTMQIFALSSGSFTIGALTMGVFALGTAPGLLGIGGLASFVKGKSATHFYRIVSIVVIGMAAWNISNGLNLAGITMPQLARAANQNDEISTVYKRELATAPVADGQIVGDLQVLKASFTNKQDLQPYDFTVKAGNTVQMEIDVKEDGVGCMASFVIPRLSNKIEMLRKGTLVYTFTPTKPGKYQMACAMGVPRGTITVI